MKHLHSVEFAWGDTLLNEEMDIRGNKLAKRLIFSTNHRRFLTTNHKMIFLQDIQ